MDLLRLELALAKIILANYSIT